MRELSCPIRRFQFSPDSVSITLAEMCTNAAFMRVFHRLYCTLSTICTSHPCLGAPTGGLLAKLPGMAADDRYRAHWALVETALGVVSAVPAAPRVTLLRTLAVLVRGLRAAAALLPVDGQTANDGTAGVGAGGEVDARVMHRLGQDLSAESWATVRVLREAAIVQHAAELPAVGAQRAQFSPGLQALVEVVSLLNGGPAQDVGAMSRHQLVRAIEAVDGPPGMGLCRALLLGSEEQVRWCLCRGAKPEAACDHHLVAGYAPPHYALHYAALGGSALLVELLVARRADVHAVDGEGNSALAWAAAAGQVEAASALLGLGCDWRHRNMAGLSALDLALQALPPVATAVPTTATGSSVSSTAASVAQPPLVTASMAAVGGACRTEGGLGSQSRSAAGKSHVASCVSLLQAQETAIVVYRLPGLLLSVEAGHGLPSLTGPTLLPGVHGHALQRSTRANEWRCDGCSAPGLSGARYRSTGPGCDFDLCQNCWDAANVFHWGDVRTAAAAAVPIHEAATAPAASKQPQLTPPPQASAAEGALRLEAIATDSYTGIPDAWRHDGWLPASARCRNSGTRGNGFPFLRVDRTAVLRSTAPVRVGTLILVVRFPRAAMAALPSTSARTGADDNTAHSAAPADGAESDAGRVGRRLQHRECLVDIGIANAVAEGPVRAGRARVASTEAAAAVEMAATSASAAVAAALREGAQDTGAVGSRDLSVTLAVGATETAAPDDLDAGSAGVAGSSMRSSLGARTVAGVHMMAEAGLMHTRADLRAPSSRNSPALVQREGMSNYTRQSTSDELPSRSRHQERPARDRDGPAIREDDGLTGRDASLRAGPDVRGRDGQDASGASMRSAGRWADARPPVSELRHGAYAEGDAGVRGGPGHRRNSAGGGDGGRGRGRDSARREREACAGQRCKNVSALFV